MSPDPVRPDGDVAVRVVAALNDAAARAALHMGQRPVRELSLWLTPDSPHWSDAVDLLPEVPDDTDHVLVVNPDVTVEVTDTTLRYPPRWKAIAGRQVPRWPAPRITVRRSEAPTPLDVWPEGTAELLEIAGRCEQAVAARVGRASKELRAATKEWAASLPKRLDEWDELYDLWRADSTVTGLFPDDGSDELVRLGDALAELRDLVDAGAHQRVDKEPSSTPITEMIAVPAEVSAADSTVHSAIEAFFPHLLARRAEKRKVDDRKAADLEAVNWVAEHGSDRLKMAVEAGILDQAMGAYRDERLSEEHPGWMWVSRDDTGELDNKAMNPSEDAIRLLLEARNTVDENAYLAYHTGHHLQFLVAGFLGRRIWRPVDPDWTIENLNDDDTLTVSVYDAVVRNAPPVAYDDAEEPF